MRYLSLWNRRAIAVHSPRNRRAIATLYALSMRYRRTINRILIVALSPRYQRTIAALPTRYRRAIYRIGIVALSPRYQRTTDALSTRYRRAVASKSPRDRINIAARSH
jgi:hypothetical protein